jgi:hypothetical protein
VIILPCDYSDRLRYCVLAACYRFSGRSGEINGWRLQRSRKFRASSFADRQGELLS